MPVRGIYFEADREAFSFTTVVKKPLKDIAKGTPSADSSIVIPPLLRKINLLNFT